MQGSERGKRERGRRQGVRGGEEQGGKMGGNGDGERRRGRWAPGERRSHRNGDERIDPDEHANEHGEATVSKTGGDENEKKATKRERRKPGHPL